MPAKKKACYLYLFLPILFLLNCLDKPTLLSGPMVGGVAMRSALIWVQLDYRNEILPDTLEVEVRNSINVSLKEGTGKDNFLSTAKVNSRTGIAIFELRDLKPGKEYNYKIVGYPEASGRFRTKPLWKFREPMPPDFSFIIASCHYVNEEPYDRKGKPWGAGYEIFQAIEKENSDFFLWMGDNVYLREADWDSPSGILHRFSHTRALPESRKVFANMGQFAIWDDHDYGPNDASKSYSLRDVVDGIQKEFWPDFNYPEKGVFRNFTWGDAEFFLLDNRRFRSANRNATDNNRRSFYGKRTILGEEQLDWLFTALADSTARFKFIVMGGQFLNTAAVFENYANYPEERQLILDTIRKMKLENVVFLTGDRHHSEISVFQGIHEFTVSPITAGVPGSPVTEKNLNRVPGSLFQERLYGVVQIRTVDKYRQIEVSFKDTKGESVYSYTLR